MVKKKEKIKSEENSLYSETTNKENLWRILTFIFAAVLVFFGILAAFGLISFGSGISKNAAEKKFLEFAKAQGVDVQVLDVQKRDSLYEISFSFQGQTGSFFMTRDGKYLGQMTKLEGLTNSVTGQAVKEVQKEVPKSDKPKLELFVMTHCPYGTQAEKGFIPFMESIGQKVDAKIRFVHYFMHGKVEENETYRQLCIREEQPNKYIAYLKCFLEGNGVVDPTYGLVMEGKDPEVCMKSVGVDINKVKQCISNGNGKKYFEEDSKLSKQYGVQGSPTLVVNGVEVSSGRSPAAYLQTACLAFNNEPQECKTLNLSKQTPTPYFGWDSSNPKYSSASAQASTESLCGV